MGRVKGRGAKKGDGTNIGAMLPKYVVKGMRSVKGFHAEEEERILKFFVTFDPHCTL